MNERGETIDLFYLGYPITLGHSRVTAADPDGHEVYSGRSLSSARAAIRADRRGANSVLEAIGHAQLAQARRLGYRDASTRYDPTDTKGDN